MKNDLRIGKYDRIGISLQLEDKDVRMCKYADVQMEEDLVRIYADVQISEMQNHLHI